MKLVLSFCLLLLLADPGLTHAQTPATPPAAVDKTAGATLRFLRPKDNSPNEFVVTLRNQEPFLLTDNSVVEFGLQSDGPITITLETREPVTTSRRPPVSRQIELTVVRGQTYQFLLKNQNLKALSAQEAALLSPGLTPYIAAESSTQLINDDLDVFADGDGPAYSTVHFIRSNSYFGSACRTDLTLPNQREFLLNVGSVVHYKVYSEGELSVTLQLNCPGSNNMRPTSRAMQMSLRTKQGEHHYVFCNASGLREISSGEARPHIDRNRSVMKQEESLDMPINRSSIRDAAKRSGKGQGTCFLVSADGYLITNYHCVENSKEIVIKGINDDFSTGHAAMVIASDPSNDLALLRLTERTLALTPPPFGLRASGVLQAERIYALGFPVAVAMGNEVKITEGIISSRSGVQGDISKFQISAAVNPGNSGGPLIDEEGNVVGVVYAKSGVADAAGYAVKALYLEALLKNVDNFTYPTFVNTLKDLSLPKKVEALRKGIFIVETK